MNECAENAIDELKRADHMLFVSLKYTRTCDVIKNIIERLVACFDFTFDYIAVSLKEKKKIDSVPSARAIKIDVLKDYFKENKEFQSYLEFYYLLRRINKAEFTRRQEFRRHVTMTAVMDDDCLLEVNIDTIYEYYNKTKSFMDLAFSMFEAKEP